MKKTPAKAAAARTWKELLPLRLALHGWAFTADDLLSAQLRNAEEILALLPQSARHAGELMIQPLRNEVAKHETRN